MNNYNMFDIIGKDVTFYILSYLEIPDLLMLKNTNKYFIPLVRKKIRKIFSFVSYHDIAWYFEKVNPNIKFISTSLAIYYYNLNKRSLENKTNRKIGINK